MTTTQPMSNTTGNDSCGDVSAFVVDPLACHACRLCIDACPENALTLAPIPANTTGPRA